MQLLNYQIAGAKNALIFLFTSSSFSVSSWNTKRRKLSQMLVQPLATLFEKKFPWQHVASIEEGSVCVQMHKHIHINSHTHTQAYIHNTHIHLHTHTRKHTCIHTHPSCVQIFSTSFDGFNFLLKFQGHFFEIKNFTRKGGEPRGCIRCDS